MKKRSLFIVVAMVLLLAVVLGMGGTTFAKYITTKEVPTETATVAKWGYVITADATGLFSPHYQGNTQVAAFADTVDVSGSADRVAPGTSGSMSFSIAGTAEVASEVVVAIKANPKTVTLTSFKVAGSDTDTTANYEPIKWTITKNGGATTVTDGTFEAMKNYVDAIDATYKPNEVVNDTYVISWAWAFDDTATLPSANLYDTVLGDHADSETANYTDIVANLTVSFGFDITVQQIQNAAPTP